MFFLRLLAKTRKPLQSGREGLPNGNPEFRSLATNESCFLQRRKQLFSEKSSEDQKTSESEKTCTVHRSLFRAVSFVLVIDIENTLTTGGLADI